MTSSGVVCWAIQERTDSGRRLCAKKTKWQYGKRDVRYSTVVS